jgi:hypothetical protein
MQMEGATMNRSLLATLVFAVGCAHTTPEEMTIEEHRAEASRHQLKANEEESKYVDGQMVRGPARTPFVEPGGDWQTYNPTQHHLDAADREMRQAASHLAAANQLESFENNSCKDIPPSARAACPLLASAVTQVQEMRSGVRLVLKPTVDAVDTNRRLNCHLAYAYASGFDRPSCPLFIKGMTIRLVEKDVLELSASDTAVARKIQTEARRIFTGAAAPVSSR